MTVKPIVTYIEAHDGFIPTRPAPLIIRVCTDATSNLWDVRLIDQHGNPHTFIQHCTEDDAEVYAHTLATVALALSRQEVITVAYLDDILEANAAEKARRCAT